MELQFKKVGKRWVAEFEATGNFNLNIERVEPSKIKIYQKGSEEGEYASSASWEINYAPSVVDNDFSALIYPKFIKVVSESEPIQGIVTMDSESGGSGAGGGLRPITADDVTLEIENGMSGQATTIPFATSIFLEQSQNLVIRYEKEIFVGTESNFKIEDGKLRYYNMATPQEVKLDLYTKD